MSFVFSSYVVFSHLYFFISSGHWATEETDTVMFYAEISLYFFVFF